MIFKREPHKGKSSFKIIQSSTDVRKVKALSYQQGDNIRGLGGHLIIQSVMKSLIGPKAFL